MNKGGILKWCSYCQENKTKGMSENKMREEHNDCHGWYHCGSCCCGSCAVCERYYFNKEGEYEKLEDCWWGEK